MAKVRKIRENLIFPLSSKELEEEVPPFPGHYQPWLQIAPVVGWGVVEDEGVRRAIPLLTAPFRSSGKIVAVLPVGQEPFRLFKVSFLVFCTRRLEPVQTIGLSLLHFLDESSPAHDEETFVKKVLEGIRNELRAAWKSAVRMIKEVESCPRCGLEVRRAEAFDFSDDFFVLRVPDALVRKAEALSRQASQEVERLREELQAFARETFGAEIAELELDGVVAFKTEPASDKEACRLLRALAYENHYRIYGGCKEGRDLRARLRDFQEKIQAAERRSVFENALKELVAEVLETAGPSMASVGFRLLRKEDAWFVTDLRVRRPNFLWVEDPKEDREQDLVRSAVETFKKRGFSPASVLVRIEPAAEQPRDGS